METSIVVILFFEVRYELLSISITVTFVSSVEHIPVRYLQGLRAVSLLSTSTHGISYLYYTPHICTYASTVLVVVLYEIVMFRWDYLIAAHEGLRWWRTSQHKHEKQVQFGQVRKKSELHLYIKIWI